MTYALRVKFKSNEAPWSGGYEPAERHQPADDTAAIEWAAGMSDGLGSDYLVTLIKDGTVIPLPLPLDELEPHSYVPSATHMGDCRICGHLQGAAIHSRLRR